MELRGLPEIHRRLSEEKVYDCLEDFVGLHPSLEMVKIRLNPEGDFEGRFCGEYLLEGHEGHRPIVLAEFTDGGSRCVALLEDGEGGIKSYTPDPQYCAGERERLTRVLNGLGVVIEQS
jgi:hypothetical protein